MLRAMQSGIGPNGATVVNVNQGMNPNPFITSGYGNPGFNPAYSQNFGPSYTPGYNPYTDPMNPMNMNSMSMNYAQPPPPYYPPSSNRF